MSFKPDKINMQTCGASRKNSGCVNITVCFGYIVKSEKEDHFSTGKLVCQSVDPSIIHPSPINTYPVHN